MKKAIMKYKLGIMIIAIIISSTGLYSCNKDTPVNTTQTNNLSFNALSSVDSAGDSQNFFVLDTVKILIKDIKLNVANSNEDSCNFKIGPFVLFLNFSSRITEVGTTVIPEGTYNKIKFEVHKLNVNESIPDPEFADINNTYSVIVKGSYLGNYFVYKSTKSAHQMLQFPNNCPITSTYYSNITMIVKPYIWFIKNGVYLDPRDPANSNDIDNNIKDNIKNNFKAFKDDDRNGVPD